METRKISVIVPIYKVERYLCRCLDSITGQTHQNLEIILVDDGSPDRCGAICDQYEASDKRVRVLHTKNRGAFAARNTALDTASGDYIGFVDADDWLESEMYAVLLALAEETHADVAQCEMCNEGNYAQLRSKTLGGTAVYLKGQLTQELFRENITHGLNNKLFRREIWRNRRFPEEYYHMDAACMTEVERFCGTFARTDAVLYHYNTTNPSITRGRKKPLHAASAEKLFEAYSTAAEDVPEGAFFICREIPSFGRLIPPGGDVSLRLAVGHVRRMHKIFERHWDVARETAEYRASPRGKRLLWSIYHRAPLLASVLVYIYGTNKADRPRIGRKEDYGSY